MALAISDFALLFLATLANEPEHKIVLSADANRRKQNEKKNKKIANLPFDYRQRIENIMCAENGWKTEFSCLIDVEEYFEDHFYWEECLASEIDNVAERYKIKKKRNLVTEVIPFKFKPSDVEEIITSFKDEEVIKKMEHFVSLVSDRLYSRRHQEEFTDYTARTRALMHKKFENECMNMPEEEQ